MSLYDAYIASTGNVLAAKRIRVCASEKGKPVVRRGRKAHGPPSWEVAGLSNSKGGATMLRPQSGKRVRMQSHLKHSRTRLMFHSSSGLSHCRFRRPAEKRKALNAYKKLPLSFIPNESQTDEAVRYYAQGAGYIPSDLVVMAELMTAA